MSFWHHAQELGHWQFWWSAVEKGESIFGFFDFRDLTTELDWQKNTKTKAYKRCFFIFMSSYAERTQKS
jgi:hypothetical protein